MRRAEIDPERPDPVLLAVAAGIIRDGGLVAFPTETVYGLGGNALDERAIRRIFAAKERPSFNPLIAHVSDAAAARKLALAWPEIADRLGERFWPGPLTLVVSKAAGVPDALTAGLTAVAVRVPAHRVARGLIDAAGVPIAAPSANRFTELSPTSAAHVEKALGDRVDLILDGGPTQVGIESTVIDLTGEAPTLLRPGSLDRRLIESVVGPLALPRQHRGAEPRPAPGMVERHYSPRARLTVIAAGDHAEIARLAADAAAGGLRVGALLRGDADAPLAHRVRMPADPAGYARALYATLHELDELGCDLILVEAVPEDSEWGGIRDRVRRAAHQG